MLFIYCGKLETLKVNVTKLYQAADLYLIDSLRGTNIVTQETYCLIPPIGEY